MDNDAIIKVSTFRSGTFVFSWKYNRSDIDPLLYCARLLYETVIAIPVLPQWSTRFEEEIIRRSIFGTAALEGNPLKEEEVDKIIHEEPKSKKADRAEQEIRNLKAVYTFISKQAPASSPVEVTENFIKETHRIITADITYTANVPGNYRPHEVKVGDKEHGGVYTPPKCLPDIEALMTRFIEWINSDPVKALDPLLRGALAHYHLGLIHPFGDGNGRVARIVEAFMLRLSNMKYVPTMLSNYYYRKTDAYYWAFSLARKNKEDDVTPFLKFVLEGVIDALNEIKAGVTQSLQLLLMRDYTAHLKEKKLVSQRQCDLIDMLLSNRRPITLQELLTVTPFNALYRNVSERTARRDLQKLADKSIGVLKLENDKFHLNYELFK